MVSARRWVTVCALATLIGLVSASSPAQKKGTLVGPQAPRKTQATLSLRLAGGLGFPLSKDGLRQFWKGGPAGTAQMLVGINRTTAFGLGADVNALWFKSSSFAGTYPGVATQRHDPYFFHIYVLSRFTLLPSMRLTPFVSVTAGAARVTRSIYLSVVGGYAVSYYDLAGKTHLAVGVSGGLEYRVNRSLALDAEMIATTLNNDPDVGTISSARVGVKLLL